jgi:hypothetical protein
MVMCRDLRHIFPIQMRNPPVVTGGFLSKSNRFNGRALTTQMAAYLQLLLWFPIEFVSIYLNKWRNWVNDANRKFQI